MWLLVDAISVSLSAKSQSSFILHFATFNPFSLFYLVSWVWMNISKYWSKDDIDLDYNLIWITLGIINLLNSLKQKYYLLLTSLAMTLHQSHLADVIIAVLPVKSILHTVFCDHLKLFSSLTLKISILFLFFIH